MMKLSHRWAGTAIFLLAIISGTFYSLRFNAGPKELLWFCNIALIVLSIAAFFKVRILFGAVLIAAIPAQFFWIWGNGLLLFGARTFGRYNWISGHPFGWGHVFEMSYHFTIIPLALFGTWRYGYHRRSAWAALAIFLPMLLASLWLAQPIDNINCMYFSCDEPYSEIVLNRYGGFYPLYRILSFIAASCLADRVCRRIFPEKKAL